MKLEARNRRMGRSKIVRRKTNFFCKMQSETQAAPMIEVSRKTTMILLNSKSSEVLGRKIRGTMKTRA